MTRKLLASLWLIWTMSLVLHMNARIVWAGTRAGMGAIWRTSP